MICCYLLHRRRFTSPDDVLEFYSRARTNNQKVRKEPDSGVDGKVFASFLVCTYLMPTMPKADKILENV